MSVGRCWLAAWMLIGVGCSGGGAGRCPTDGPTWSTVGEPFVGSWCAGCHSAQLDAGSRAGAPLGLDLDTAGDVRAHLDAVQQVLVDETMPPTGGPSDSEVRAFERWLDCGAPRRRCSGAR